MGYGQGSPWVMGLLLSVPSLLARLVLLLSTCRELGRELDSRRGHSLGPGLGSWGWFRERLCLPVGGLRQFLAQMSSSGLIFSSLVKQL